VLILGIDRSGKTTLLERIKTLYTEHAGLTPDKIQPTVGLNIGRAEACSTKLVFWDLGGAVGLRAIWEKYFGEAHAVVFVVDAADSERFEEAKNAFTKAIASKDLTGAPVLVLANKHDIVKANATAGSSEGLMQPDSSPGGMLGTSVDLQNIMGISRVNKPQRPCRLFACSALSGDGVKDGLVWLVDIMHRSQRSKMLNQDQMFHS